MPIPGDPEDSRPYFGRAACRLAPRLSLTAIRWGRGHLAGTKARNKCLRSHHPCDVQMTSMVNLFVDGEAKSKFESNGSDPGINCVKVPEAAAVPPEFRGASFWLRSDDPSSRADQPWMTSRANDHECISFVKNLDAEGRKTSPEAPLFPADCYTMCPQSMFYLAAHSWDPEATAHAGVVQLFDRPMDVLVVRGRFAPPVLVLPCKGWGVGPANIVLRRHVAIACRFGLLTEGHVGSAAEEWCADRKRHYHIDAWLDEHCGGIMPNYYIAPKEMHEEVTLRKGGWISVFSEFDRQGRPVPWNEATSWRWQLTWRSEEDTFDVNGKIDPHKSAVTTDFAGRTGRKRCAKPQDCNNCQVHTARMRFENGAKKLFSSMRSDEPPPADGRLGPYRLQLVVRTEDGKTFTIEHRKRVMLKIRAAIYKTPRTVKKKYRYYKRKAAKAGEKGKHL